jgi:hypothetical protein
MAIPLQAEMCRRNLARSLQAFSSVLKISPERGYDRARVEMKGKAPKLIAGLVET